MLVDGIMFTVAVKTIDFISIFSLHYYEVSLSSL